MSETDWTLLSIPFKGDRAYLQSANVWDVVAEFILADDFPCDTEFKAQTTVLDIIFKRIMSTKVELYLSDKRPPKDQNVVAQIILTTADNKKMFGALRTTSMQENGRFEDIENSFKPDVELLKTGSTFSGNTPVTLSQMYVAMIKFWHQKFISDDCKWLATRLQLPLSHRNGYAQSIHIKPTTVLDDGAGSISDIDTTGFEPSHGRIYFFRTEIGELQI